MNDPRTIFTRECTASFRVLVDRYAFSEPEIRPMGWELYVEYHKGDRTVSVCHEDGFSPLIELFHPPVAASDRPVAWAERNGVARCRRFPRLDVSARFDHNDPAQLARYLRECVAALERTESDWLNRGVVDGHDEDLDR